MMKPKVEPSIWRDEEFLEQPLEVKVAVFWLFTNEGLSILGLQKRAERRFAFDTGLDRAWLQKTLEAMPRFCVQEGEWLFVRNYIRKQFGEGAKLIRNQIGQALLEQLEGLPKPLRGLVEAEYPELADALAKGLHRGAKGLRAAYGLEGSTQGLGKGFVRASTPVNVDSDHSGVEPELGAHGEPPASPSEGLAKGKGIGTGTGEGIGTLSGGVGDVLAGRATRSGDGALGTARPTSDAEIPSPMEVLSACAMDGIDEAYGTRFWHQMENTHGWERNRRLVKWRNILAERWGQDRPRWMDGTMAGSPHKKNAAGKNSAGKPDFVVMKELEAELAGHHGNPKGPEYRPGAEPEVMADFREKKARWEALKRGGAACST